MGYIGNDYMINYSEIFELVNLYLVEIKKKSFPQENPIIFLAEKRSKHFIAIFLASIINKSCLFLINPHWKKQEWQQVENIVSPDLVFGEINYLWGKNKQKYPRFDGIMIPTGGTSGKIKFAIHTWETLTASAQGFYQYFDYQPINQYCCLPLYHVSGLMQFIRSFTAGGKLIVQDYQNLKNNLITTEDYPDYFISLVPTQLQFFLDKNLKFLQKFKTILVGGASIYPQQIKKARINNLPLALTYGMTETASGISILKPEEFKNNNDSSGKILPHAEVIIKKNIQELVTIKSSSLFKGYYPDYQENKLFITDDIGTIDKEGYLYIKGRKSQKIITGGENAYPLEIETAILETKLVKDIHVRGEKHSYWGEIIVAFYVPITENIKEEDIKVKLKEKISNYKIPKIWHKLDKIPRNSQGKVNLFTLK